MTTKSKGTTTNGEAPSEFDWQSVIDQSLDSWPEPEDCPTGTWQFQVRAGKLDRSKGTALIVLRPVAPIANVDETKLAKYDLASGVVFAKYRLGRHDEVRRFKQLMRSIGLGEYNTEDALKSIKDAVLAGEITHSPRDDGTDGVYVNVNRLGPMAA